MVSSIVRDSRTAARRSLVLVTALAVLVGLMAIPAPRRAEAQTTTAGEVPTPVAELTPEELVESALSNDPVYGAGFRARIDGYRLLRGFPLDDMWYDRALQDLAAGLGNVVGDWIVDAQGFQDHESAQRNLRQLAHGQDAALSSQAEAAQRLLTLADRVAAVRAIQFVEAVLRERTIDDAERSAVDNAVENARADLDRGDRHYERSEWMTAINEYGKAWKTVGQAQADLWAAIDGDFDMLPEDIERELGLDPNNPDTDGDGLTDITEIWTTGTDPQSGDTNGLGIPDGERDPDGDGLTSLRELEVFSDPLYADTDGEGLEDGFEVDVFGSDPTRDDTDADGLEDDSEFRLGTDPNNPDTDGDGTRDGDEVYTTTADFAATGVSVAITGVGDLAETASLRDHSADEIYTAMPGLVSSVVDLEADGEFDTATISIPFDVASVPDGDVANLGVLYYDEEIGRFVPVDGPVTVDEATGTINATTSHFTLFAVFYIPNWNAVFEAWDPDLGGGGDPTDQFIDITLVLDSSGSMAWNDPQGLRRVAAKSFIDGLLVGDRVAVIDFDSSARVVQGLTTDFEAAKAAVDFINSSGGTNIGAAVSASNNELINNGDPDHARISVLLTDGEGSYSSVYTQQAIDNDITIYTIGLGSSVDTALLTQIAEATGGQYFPVANADDLPDVFSRLPVNLDPAGDADGDGLLNGLELGGILAGNGKTYHTNPLDPDTDGDGLGDGEELWENTIVPGPTPGAYVLQSDPLKPDTDGDLLLDGEEGEMGTLVRSAYTDGDNLTDGLELAVGYDPFDANPDGDERPDHEELAEGSDPFVYDLTGADGVRAFIAGGLFGEAGDLVGAFDTSLKELLGDVNDWADIPYLSDAIAVLTSVGEGLVDLGCIGVGIGNWFFGWAGPFNPFGGPQGICEVLDFRIKWDPEWSTRLPYLGGWITVALIPFLDIVAGLRDLVASIVKGSWLGAGLEAIFVVIGIAPVVGDIPKIADATFTFLSKSRSAARAVFKFLVTRFPDLFLEIAVRVAGVTDDLLARMGGLDGLKRLANNNVDLGRLVKFLKLPGSKLSRFAVTDSSSVLQRIGSRWAKAGDAASPTAIRRLAAEAVSTEAAVSYLTREGFDILYVGRNLPFQVSDDAEVFINKGPDIIAVNDGRTVVVEVKGSSQDALTLGRTTITSEVARRPRTQTSRNWIATNADSRYLTRLRQAGQFDPDLAAAANRIDDIITNRASYDVLIIGASQNTRIGSSLEEALVTANGTPLLGNNGAVEIVELNFDAGLLSDAIDALTP